jgi:branched-chain amino acid transport system ATP-binding protein
LLEKALAAADRVYALVQGHIVLEAATTEANLPQRLEHAYLGRERVHPREGRSGPQPSA